ncbi:MAG: cellulase family glycosylhydrolase [candidate division WOR-3 bacterium]|nr:cellulase family glycosylhydrolase [candidate division WOR-3 bacterium]
MEKTCFLKDEKPVYLIGANYWPRKTGPLMWRKWDSEEVGEELEQMKSLGMNVCRSFLYFPDFMPRPFDVNKDMLERFAEFVALCEKVDIYTIPTFFVGHMSGEDWDVNWRKGKNFYNDPWMLTQETLYVREVVKKVRNSKAIIGWLLSNEITNYAGMADAKIVLKWINTICETIRQIDTIHPISVGDGVWGQEVYGRDTGFRLREQKNVVDFFGPHFYLYEDDALRHSYIPSFIIKMCDFGKPVLLEEFGCSNCFASERHQADYYRTTYHSAFLAGAVGTLCWCYSDFSLPYQRPYSHHAHELLFGVTRKDGSIKPAGNEIKRFSKIMDTFDTSEIDTEKNNVFILIPTYYSLDYPYSREDKDMIRKVLLQSYTLTKQSHVNGGFLREPQLPEDIESKEKPSIPKEMKLLIAPNIQKFTAPFWESIYRYVEEGGMFYCSFHFDMWIHIFESLFGAKHNLRFGLAEIPEREVVELQFIKDFFDISKGKKFAYHLNGLYRDNAFCPATPTTAEVIAVDDKDRPAILLNSIGKGKVIFATYPLEYYLANTHEVYKKDETYRIYKTLVKMAGIEPTFNSPNPYVELGTIKHKENSGFLLWIINHDWEKTAGFIQTDLDIKEVTDIETGKSIYFKDLIPFDLRPKEITVYSIKID